MPVNERYGPFITPVKAASCQATKIVDDEIFLSVSRF